jgi:inner membrane protein
MATVVSHFLLGWGAYRCVEGGRDPRRTGPLVAGLVSVLPDIDALALPWIRYDAPWGHRGMTHSLAFAAVAGMLAAIALRRRVTFPGGVVVLALTLAIVTASHGVLDAMTDGGLGIAFFAPFEATRHFLPVRPIPVSPITVNPFSTWVLEVITVEALLLWPLAAALWTARRPMSWKARALLVASLVASAALWVVRCLT